MLYKLMTQTGLKLLLGTEAPVMMPNGIVLVSSFHTDSTSSTASDLVVLCFQVVDQRNSDDYAMKQSEFFKAFRAGGDRMGGSSEPVMLKVKDYPPDAAFAEEMPRHWQVRTI